MKIGEQNGYELHHPQSGGKAGKNRALTGTIQVRKDSIIVKQFRFKVGDKNSYLAAMEKAEEFVYRETASLGCNL